MSEEIKAQVVEDENPSAAEKETVALLFMLNNLDSVENVCGFGFFAKIN